MPVEKGLGVQQQRVYPRIGRHRCPRVRYDLLASTMVHIMWNLKHALRVFIGSCRLDRGITLITALSMDPICQSPIEPYVSVIGRTDLFLLIET